MTERVKDEFSAFTRTFCIVATVVGGFWNAQNTIQEKFDKLSDRLASLEAKVSVLTSRVEKTTNDK